jgi:hypothetical protein
MWIKNLIFNLIFYAAPHPHAQEFNILQHRSCGEIRVSHIETDALAAPKHPIEPNPQTKMWQLRKSYIPKQQNKITNSNQPKAVSNTPTKQYKRLAA